MNKDCSPFCLVNKLAENIAFSNLPEVMESEETSERLAGLISTYPGTSQTSCCQDIGKISSGSLFPGAVYTAS